MSAQKPVIKVDKLSEVTGKNQLTKILKERKNKDGVVVFPVKLLNFDDGETFDVTLATEPKNIEVGSIVEVEKITIMNFPNVRTFGTKDYAMSNWQYVGEKITKMTPSPQSANQSR